MQPEEAKEIKGRIERTIREIEEHLKDLVKKTSTAGLLAENEPIGDLVVYALIDDARKPQTRAIIPRVPQNSLKVSRTLGLS